MGDKYSATLNTIPFANGNATVSQKHLQANVVIPSLHAFANGSTFGASGGGPVVEFERGGYVFPTSCRFRRVNSTPSIRRWARIFRALT